MTSAYSFLLPVILTDLLFQPIIVFYYAAFARIWFNMPIRPRRCIICSLINIASRMVVHFATGLTPVTFMLTAATFYIISRILWRPLRGAQFWKCFFFCIVSEFILEFVTEWCYQAAFPDGVARAQIGNIQVFYTKLPKLPGLILFYLSFFCGSLFLFRSIHRVWQGRANNDKAWKYQLRLIILFILLVFSMIVFAYSFNVLLYQDGDGSRVFSLIGNNIGTFLVCFMAIILLLFYCWQTFQQYRLFVDNKSLRGKNVAYQRILDSTREFRHNISNLIYGFEGVILTENIDSIKEYYSELTRRCLLNNNENATAINLIHEPALAALLLQKLDAAASQELPVYLNADSVFSFDGLPPAKLAESLGNLMDNAMEAALKSSSPRVNVTFSSTPEYDEILLSNTYAEDADLSFLTGEERSSKPDHQATGLVSVKRILSRYPDICFNQYKRGRYIETSLCYYRI